MKSLLHNLLGIEPATWTEGGSWSLDWVAMPGGDRALLLIVAVIGGAAGLWWLYKRDAKRLVAWRRWLLMTLRAATIALVAVMLLEPVVVLSKTEHEPSDLLVLLDVSPSMGLSDAWADRVEASVVAEKLGLAGVEALRGSDRLALARRALDDRLIAALENDGDRRVRVHGFAERLSDTPLAADSDVQLEGQHTALGAALRQVLLAYRGKPVSGVLVVSDGRSNAGTSAAKAAQFAAEEDITVAALAVGTTEGPRNVSIEAIESDPVVFVRDENRVEVLIRSRGTENEPTTVTLEASRRGGPWEPLDERMLNLEGNGQLQRVAFNFSEARPTELRLRATVAALDAEQNTDDNAALADVRVIRQELRVLFIAGSTFPEVQFLRNTLLRDRGIEVSTWLMTADTDYQHPGDVPIRRLPNTAEELGAYDCIVLYDPSPTGWPSHFPELMSDFVAKAGGGLIYIAGEQHTRTSFDRQNDPLLKWLTLLPVVREPGLFRTAQQLIWSARQAWHLQITPEGQRDPVFAFAGDPAENARILNHLPGMYWHFPVTRARPGATVLARHGDPRMQNDYGQEVLLATQLVGPGRTFFVAFDSTYRWRYLDEQLFDGFWARLIDRAGRSKQLGGVYPFRLSTDRPTYSPGSPVTVTARFVDNDQIDPGLTVMHAEVERGDDAPIVLSLQRQADDTFAGSFTAEKAGQHLARVWAGDTATKAIAKPATLAIEVALPDLEFEDPALDRATLDTLARATGGAVFDLTQLDELPGVFKVGQVGRVLEDRQEIWDAPLFWGLLVIVLISEWIIRKRYRLV